MLHIGAQDFVLERFIDIHGYLGVRADQGSAFEAEPFGNHSHHFLDGQPAQEQQERGYR